MRRREQNRQRKGKRENLAGIREECEGEDETSGIAEDGLDLGQDLPSRVALGGWRRRCIDCQQDRACARHQGVCDPEVAPADGRQQWCGEQHQHDAGGHVRAPCTHHEIPRTASDHSREYARDGKDNAQEAGAFDDARLLQNERIRRAGPDSVAEPDGDHSADQRSASAEPADHDPSADPHRGTERREGGDDQPGEVQTEHQVAADHRNGDDGFADLRGSDDASADQ
ncbi:MAG: hypothetical protein WAO08_22925 [Hyphomicrobiaceae bacterium]